MLQDKNLLREPNAARLEQMVRERERWAGGGGQTDSQRDRQNDGRTKRQREEARHKQGEEKDTEAVTPLTVHVTFISSFSFSTDIIVMVARALY